MGRQPYHFRRTPARKLKSVCYMVGRSPRGRRTLFSARIGGKSGVRIWESGLLISVFPRELEASPRASRGRQTRRRLVRKVWRFGHLGSVATISAPHLPTRPHASRPSRPIYRHRPLVPISAIRGPIAHQAPLSGVISLRSSCSLCGDVFGAPGLHGGAFPRNALFYNFRFRGSLGGLLRARNAFAILFRL